MSCTVINALPNIETYLELGINDNQNFNAINAKIKDSVDINGNAIFNMTTDKFFDVIDKSKKYEVIFIDANHDYEFVLRDFNNSTKHATKWIIIHDMIPPDFAHTDSRLCSDSYKLLYYFLTSTNFQIFPMNENYGLTLIKMPAHEVHPSDQIRNLPWNIFYEFISNQKLWTRIEIEEMLRK